MQPEAILINQPSIDFSTFLSVSLKALGYSPAGAVDASRKEFSDSAKFLSCLSALKDKAAPAGVTPELLGHVSFSVLIVCSDRDVIDIVSAAAGMPFVSTETVAAGVSLAVLTGTLAQWRDAVKTGANANQAPAVRACFSKILLLFDSAGLTPVWNEFTRKPAPDRTGFYLEDKRK